LIPARIVLVALSLAALTASADAPSPPGCQEALARLIEASRKAAPTQAHFRHVLQAKTLNQTEVEEGVVILAPGGKMRWEYTRPPGKLAVSDGKTSYLFLPESNEVFVQPLGPDAPLLFRLLSGHVKLSEEVACRGVVSDGTRAILSLKLLKPNAEVDHVEVTTDAKSGEVVEVRYADALGNEISLSLSEVQQPKDVPESTFAFKIPQGARVIKAE